MSQVQRSKTACRVGRGVRGDGGGGGRGGRDVRKQEANRPKWAVERLQKRGGGRKLSHRV